MVEVVATVRHDTSTTAGVISWWCESHKIQRRYDVIDWNGALVFRFLLRLRFWRGSGWKVRRRQHKRAEMVYGVNVVHPSGAYFFFTACDELHLLVLRVDSALPFSCMDSEDDGDEREIGAMQVFQWRVGNEAAVGDFAMMDTSSVKVA